MSNAGRSDVPDRMRTGVVNLTEQDARELARLLRLLGQVSPRTGDYEPVPVEDRKRPTPEALKAKAREIYSLRKRRSQFFSSAMFGEAAWDMLLALYLCDEVATRQPIGALIAESGAPYSSALRWLSYLENHGLVSREPHPADRRTAFVALTDKGRGMLEAYFETALTNGLS